MAGIELATGYVSLVPSAKGIGAKISQELTGPLNQVAAQQGAQVSRTIGSSITSGVVGLGKVVAGAVIGGLGAVTAFGAASAHEFASVGGEVIRFTRLTGLGAEASSKLRFAAKETGVDIDQLAQGVGILSKHLAANDGAAKAVGVAYRDAAGNLRPMDAVLLDVAERFKTMPDGVEKNALALKLFGRSGLAMIPFLNKGRDGLAELEAEAQKFGLVLSADNVAAVQKNIEAQRGLHAAWSGVRVQLGQYVLPLLTRGTIAFTSFALKGIKVARDWVIRLTPTLRTVFALAKQVITDFFSGLLHGTDALGSVQSRFAVFGAQVRAVFEGIRRLIAGDTQGFAALLDSAFGATGRFVGPLRTLGNVVVGVVGFLSDHREALLTFAKVLAGLLIAEQVAGKVNALGGAVSGLVSNLNPANSQLATMVRSIAGIVSKTVSVTVQGIQASLDGIASVAKAIAGLSDRAIKVTANVTADIKGKGAQAAGKAGDFLTSLLQNALGGALGGVLAQPSVLVGVRALMAGIGAAIVALVPNLVLAILGIGPELVGAFIQVFGPLLSGAALIALLVKFRNVLARGLGEAAGFAIAAVLTVLIVLPVRMAQIVINGIPTVVGAMVQFGQEVVGAVVGFFVQLPGMVAAAVVALPGVIASAVAAIPGIVGAMVTAVTGFVARLPVELPALALAAIAGIANFFSQLPGIAANFFGQALSIVVDFMGRIVSAIASSPIGQIVGQVMSAVADGFQRGWDFVNQLTGGALSNLVITVWTGIQGVLSVLAELPGQIIDAIGNLAGALYDLGRNVILSLARGIGDVATAPVRAAANIAKKIVDTVTGIFSIGSPSKVMLGIGRALMQGLDLGIQRGAGGPVGSMGNVAGQLNLRALAPLQLQAAGAPHLAALESPAAHTHGPLVVEAPVVVNIDGTRWVRTNARMIATETAGHSSAALHSRQRAKS